MSEVEIAIVDASAPTPGYYLQRYGDPGPKSEEWWKDILDRRAVRLVLGRQEPTHTEDDARAAAMTASKVLGCPVRIVRR